MTVICPPGFLTANKTSGEKKDRKQFLLSSLADGESRTYRLVGGHGEENGDGCGLYWRWPQESERDGELKFSGYGYSVAHPGDHPENICRKVDWSDSSRPKLEGEFEKPKRCLAWLGYGGPDERIELLLIEPRSVRDALAELMKDDDFKFNDDAVAEFVVKFSRQGTGLSTTYMAFGKPSKAGMKEAAAAWAEIRGQAPVSSLLQGGHPLLDPRFSTPAKENEDF